MKIWLNSRIGFARDLLLIALLCYIPISFIKNGIFAGVDIFPPIYASKQLVCKLFLWDSKTYFGFLNPMGPIELVPYYLIFSILDKVFHSPIIVEKAFIFLILFMIGLSAYFLIYTINPQSSSISRLLPSILYIFNPYTLISLWQLRLFGWAISVILLGLIIKGLNEINERQNRYIVIAIISILTISCAVNPPTYLVLWIPIGLYFIFSYFFNDKVHTSKFFFENDNDINPHTLLLDNSFFVYWGPIQSNTREYIHFVGTMDGRECDIRKYISPPRFVDLGCGAFRLTLLSLLALL